MQDRPDPGSAWQAALGRLQLEIPQEQFDTFLRPCAGLRWEGDCLVVGAATTFAVSWLELPLHQEMVREAVAKTVGAQSNVRYQAKPVTPLEGSHERSASVHRIVAEPASRLADLTDADDDRLNQESAVEWHNSQTRQSAGLNPRYTFDNFVVGESNQLAYHAARAINIEGTDTAPGYNPLLLYAGAGMGKTHLLHAIGNLALERRVSVRYVTSEQFTNEFVSAINRREMPEFRERYRGVDLLLLDDVQFLVGKEQTQEALFHTFNDLHQAGAQIVLTSDRPPETITPLEDRLRSRFQWGLVADIRPPSLETRLAMLHSWAADNSSEVPSSVLDIIAQRVSRNVRQLLGAFNRVVASSQLLSAPLTAESVIAQLDAIVGPDARAEVTPQQVLGKVARHYGLAAEQILSRNRTAAVALARQVTMYLLVSELGMSPTGAGRCLAGRNHSTVIHGVGRVRQAMETDGRLRHAVLAITESLTD